MTLPTVNYWIAAQLTLRKFSDGTTKTITFTNREVVSNTTNAYLPLLLEVGDVGQTMDRFSPSAFNGSLTIIDALESYGMERKFSDLLQQYTIVDQAVEIFTAKTTIGDDNPSFTSRWKGKMLTAERTNDVDRPVIRISAEARIIPRRILNRKFVKGAASSSGRYVPLVLGAGREVRPFLSAYNSSPETVEYAYGTTFGNQYVNGGVQNYYLPSSTGFYAEVKGAASTSVRPFETDLSALTVRAVPVSDELAPSDIRAIDIGWTSAKAHIVTQGYVYYYPTASATLYGFITFELWEKSSSAGGPGTKVASGRFDKSSMTWSTSAVNKVSFAFDRPGVLNSPNGYYFVIDQSITNGSAYARIAAYTGSSSQQFWLFVNGAWTKYVNTIDGDAPQMYWGLYACTLTDTTTPSGADINGFNRIDPNGIGYSYFSIAQKSVLSGIPNPNTSTLDFVCNVNGLLDNSSGSISSVASKQLDTFNHQAQLLLLTYSGSTWSLSSIYDTTYTIGHYKAFNLDLRKTQGVFFDATLIEDALRELAENSCSRIFLRNNGKLALHAWGASPTVSAVFTQDDCEITSHQILDPSNVVNRVRFGYAPNLIQNNVAAGAFEYTDIDSGYGLVLDWYTGGSAEQTAIFGNSSTLFGDRYNETEGFNFIADEETAKNLARFLGIMFRRPPEYVFIRAPIEKYEDVEPMQVIQIANPAMPAFNGSSANAKLPDYSGVTVDASGDVLTRCEIYKAQIESRVIKNTVDQAPYLLFGCRLMLNVPDQT